MNEKAKKVVDIILIVLIIYCSFMLIICFLEDNMKGLVLNGIMLTTNLLTLKLRIEQDNKSLILRYLSFIVYQNIKTYNFIDEKEKKSKPKVNSRKKKTVGEE